jgi:hypothetical protein
MRSEAGLLGGLAPLFRVAHSCQRSQHAVAPPSKLPPARPKRAPRTIHASSTKPATTNGSKNAMIAKNASTDCE